MTRWFTALASHSFARDTWGAFKWCTKKVEPAFEKKEERKASNVKEGAKKEGKKEQPKKEQGAKKEQPKKDNDKEAKEKQKQEEAEAELKAHNDKVNSWLATEIKFDFEEFKREYCNCQEGQFDNVFK